MNLIVETGFKLYFIMKVYLNMIDDDDNCKFFIFKLKIFI